MKSLAMTFAEGGATLHLDQMVEGFMAVNQDCLVNLGTRLGSDAVDADRGSNLEVKAIQSGVIVSVQSATHLANISAAETSFYIQTTEDIEEENPLQDMELETIELQNQSLSLNAVMESEQGDVIGVKALLS